MYLSRLSHSLTLMQIVFIFSVIYAHNAVAVTLKPAQVLVMDFTVPSSASTANAFSIQLNGSYTGSHTMELLDGASFLGSSTRISSGAVSHYFEESAGILPISDAVIVDFTSIADGTIDLVARLSIDSGEFTPSAYSAFFWNYDDQGNPTNVGSIAPTSISIIPIPAAVWLFGSGLLGLAGIARRRGRG